MTFLSTQRTPHNLWTGPQLFPNQGSLFDSCYNPAIGRSMQEVNRTVVRSHGPVWYQHESKQFATLQSFTAEHISLLICRDLSWAPLGGTYSFTHLQNISSSPRGSYIGSLPLGKPCDLKTDPCEERAGGVGQEKQRPADVGERPIWMAIPELNGSEVAQTNLAKQSPHTCLPQAFGGCSSLPDAINRSHSDTKEWTKS
jgi:hypothetical protein